MLLAQAVPPLWTMALSIYLVLAIPATFSAAVVAVVLGWSKVRARPVARRLAMLVFCLGWVNVGLVGWFSSVANLASPGWEAWVWFAALVAPMVLATIAWLRARRSG